MKPHIVGQILDRFLIEGLSQNVFRAVQPHKVEIKGKFSRLYPEFKMGMISNGGITLSEYIDILERNAYSAVFSDGSIIYIECDFIDGSLDNHRYFYIPCPFNEETINSAPDHIGLVQWLKDSVELESAEVFKSVGVLRFDCVRGLASTVDLHPVSHLTVASGECRIPLRGPLTISGFLNLVFDNFFRAYRPLWLQFSPYLKLDETEITIREEELIYHHLNW